MRFLFAHSIVLLLALSLLLPQNTNAAGDTRGLTIVAKDASTGKSSEVRLYSRSYAVIIGIDRYRNLPADRQLKNAVGDARGVEATLRKYYRFDRIFTLYDEQATRDNIMKLLTAELPKTVGKEDALFVFWAGHGHQEKTDDGDLGYLLPHDGTGDGIYGNVTMSQLKDDISRAIPAKHIFYAFDACYSGLLATRAVDRKPSRDLAYLREITKERVRQVLTAGGKGQETLDGGPRGHSVFTGRLIEALEAAGDYVTANEIQAILREKVFQDARARGHEQTPGYGTLYGSGDFVFVPNVEQKVQDNKAEVARMEAELKKLEAQEAEAIKYQSAQQQREAEQKRKAAEARLRAEQLRQQQLAEEAKRQQEMAQERARFEAEQRQREQELTTAQKAEEKRLASLKAELARKKQAAPTTAADSLGAAVAEIRRLAAEIEGIDAAFGRERAAGKQRIAGRYDREISAVRQSSKQRQPPPPPRDEFESEAEYRARVAKQQSSYGERIAELEQRKKQEICELEQRLAQEQQSQSADLRRSMEQLAAREFTVGAESVSMELGIYDPERQSFPVALKNRQTKSGQVADGVKVAMNGSIPLPRDAARKFKQEWQSGLVRPEMVVRAGSGEVVRVALANDANNHLLEYAGGEFMTVAERKQREPERAERERQTAGEMVSVPGGCFLMGDTFGDDYNDEKPVHEVCVSGFRIGRYEVTQGQWKRIMGNNPSHFNSCGEDCPVEQVSWDDAQAFISRLNQQTGASFRLPTEAEWEYAAQSGGKQEKFSGGDDVDSVAWYFGNSGDTPHPVGQKRANGLGIYDMSGNVWEWVSDWYDGYSGGRQQNPQGPSGGSERVIRGGSWRHVARRARAAYRDSVDPGLRIYDLGFRLASPAVQ